MPSPNQTKKELCLPPYKPENLKFKRQNTQDIKEKNACGGCEKKQDSFCNKPFAEAHTF